MNRSTWMRASHGGLLRFHVAPGDVIDEGVDVVTIDSFFTQESHTMRAPVGGIVLGMPTLPAVKPGDAVCHIAVPDRPLDDIRAEIAAGPTDLHRRIQAQQAHDVPLVPPPTRPAKGGKKKRSS